MNDEPTGRTSPPRRPTEGAGRPPDPHGVASTLRRADAEFPDGFADGALPEVDAAVEGPVGRRASLWADAWRELRTDPLFLVGAVLLALFTIMAIRPELLATTDPYDQNLADSLARPSAEHWFGTDLLGRDLFSRTIHGARASMVVGLATVFGAASIALIFGSLAGYYGGAIDAVLARFADIFFAIPTILAALVFLVAFRNLAVFAFDDTGIARVTIVLVLFGWTTMMRIARAAFIGEKEKEYVTAARALGAKDSRIMMRHILPNAMAPVVVYMAIFAGIVILVEAALSYLNVGLQLPAISWGLMISGAQNRLLQAPHLLIFPGMFLAAAVLSFIMVGDALRDAFDPRLH